MSYGCIDEVNSSKLQLVAMSDMDGFNKRRGMHHNPRTTFYGDSTHEDLAKTLFPWIEEVLEESDLDARATARGFLTPIGQHRAKRPYVWQKPKHRSIWPYVCPKMDRKNCAW